VIDGLLRGDIESRYAAYAVGRQWGWLSANMVLNKENMNQIGPQGDIFLVPINMAPADRINDVIDKQVEPTPAPVVRSNGEDMTPAVLAQIELLRQEHTDHLAKLTTEQIEDLTVVAQMVEAVKASAESDRAAKVAAEALAGDREAQATEALQRLEQLRAEWIKAQEAHQAKLEAEQMERARLQAELTRQADIVTALEGDVQDRTCQLDDAKAAKEAAEQEADTHRGIAIAATTDKAVSDAEAKAAVDLALKADERALDAQDAARLAGVALAEAQAARDAASQVLAGTEAELANTRDELRTHIQTNAERAEALLKLEAELQAATVAIDIERERADAAKAALTTTETRAETAEDQLKATRDESAARLASVLSSHRALIAAEVSRLARREATNARSKQATPQKLLGWLETFAAVEAPICVEALLPAIRTHLVWMKSTEDPAAVTMRFVKAHLDMFDARLRSVAAAEPDEFHSTLEAVLQRWESDRPTEVADAILQEGIAYVRAS
jgi:hypothetical protein